MGDPIIETQQWFETPPGRYLLDWEREEFGRAVSDIFGFHALQLGLPALDALASNRMPHRWLALDGPADSALQVKPDLVTEFSALPFAQGSLDLVVLPHTLEFSADPHATLRDVERVLVPEGKAVICGFNPASLWGLRQRRVGLYRKLGVASAFLPMQSDLIGYWRLRDWLRLLGFEVESSQFGCWRPAMAGEQWLNRYAWMDRMGGRWWPIFGAVYFLVAVKRVRGVRLIGAAWKAPAKIATAPVPLTNRIEPTQRSHHS